MQCIKATQDVTFTQASPESGKAPCGRTEHTQEEAPARFTKSAEEPMGAKNFICLPILTAVSQTISSLKLKSFSCANVNLHEALSSQYIASLYQYFHPSNNVLGDTETHN